MHILTSNETEFTLKETIDYIFPGVIESVTIANDHRYLSFMVVQENAYVYEYNGTNFTLYQNITMNY